MICRKVALLYYRGIPNNHTSKSSLLLPSSTHTSLFLPHNLAAICLLCFQYWMSCLRHTIVCVFMVVLWPLVLTMHRSWCIHSGRFRAWLIIIKYNKSLLLTLNMYTYVHCTAAQYLYYYSLQFSCGLSTINNRLNCKD